MEVHVKGFRGEIVIEDYLAADEGFEGESGKHVEAETEASEVHHGVVGGEIIEHVALGQVAEGEEAGERHEETGDHGDAGAIMGYGGEAVDGGGFEGAVDEERVVVADECERDYANGLEYSVVDG